MLLLFVLCTVAGLCSGDERHNLLADDQSYVDELKEMMLNMDNNLDASQDLLEERWGDAGQEECSKTCHEHCPPDDLGVKYGKYCGKGLTGCEGEAPCDDLDACCATHDACVGANSLIDDDCHEALSKCAKEAVDSGADGFSETCPLKTVGETIIKGMDMAEEMSDLAKGYGISGAEADKIAAGVDLDGMKTGDKIP